MSSQTSVAPLETASAPTSIWEMYRAVIGVGVFCALVIVVVFEVTRPIIERNKIELRTQAIFDVLPAAERTATFRQKESGRFEQTSGEGEQNGLVFAGYDQHGQLVGLAMEAQAMGYADVIRLIYGYSFEDQAVIGIRVLESRETPGLGDRIETDAQFLKNFERLDVRLSASGDRLAHPIEFAKAGEKTAAWQIEGISGATISSKATAKMLNESTAEWVPRVQSRQSDFMIEKGGQADDQ